MPNLRPPVTTVQEAERYYERVLEALPEGTGFEPLIDLVPDAADLARRDRAGGRAPAGSRGEAVSGRGNDKRRGGRSRTWPR